MKGPIAHLMKLLEQPILAGISAGIGIAHLPGIILQPFGFVAFLTALSSFPRFEHARAFRLGLGFGFGYHLVTLYWISLAMHVDWAQFWPLFIPALLFIPAGLAVLTGLGAVAGVQFPQGKARLLVYPLIWLAQEWIQGHLLTGLPLNPLGLSYGLHLSGLQLANTLSIYGLSFILILGYSLFVAFSQQRLRYLSLFLAFLIPFGYGTYHLYQNPVEVYPHHSFALIQPNTDQSEKFDERYVEGNFHDLIALSLDAKAEQPEGQKLVYVWPEVATAYDLTHNHGARADATHFLEKGEVLITGLMRRQKGKNLQEPHHPWIYFNSIGIFGPKRAILGLYDKHHLVPFGEYVPYREILDPLVTKITAGMDCCPGEGPTTLTLSDFPFELGPVICYESIFPGEVIDRKNRPDVMINLSNDAYYMNSAGPVLNHLHARVRAIEEGLPVARATMTGLSGVFGPQGQDVGPTLPFGVRDFAIIPVPKPAPPTLFHQYGWLPLLGLVIIYVIFGLTLLGGIGIRKSL